MKKEVKYPNMERVLRELINDYRAEFKYTAFREAISSPNIAESVKNGFDVHTLRVYGRMLLYLSTFVPIDRLKEFVADYFIAFLFDIMALDLAENSSQSNKAANKKQNNIRSIHKKTLPLRPLYALSEGRQTKSEQKCKQQPDKTGHQRPRLRCYQS
jgi:hypothetical protein